MFEVWQDGAKVASSTNEADARHYALMYGQDGGVIELLRKERGKRPVTLLRYARLPNVPLARG